jgi:dTDP-4-amino-4,6-dideoxygalactose transaminase
VIRLSKSSIGKNVKQAVVGVLDREYLGMGQEVEEFELALTKYLDRTAICVSNGTAALHLALQGIGVTNGDEVLVQSLTYVASFQAISATGAKPVACEINPKTLTIDLKDAERRITSRTKAIMPVHYAGAVGDLDEIYIFAKKHKLRVIEDAAHAFGTIYNGKLIGSFGDIVCFSFDGIKNLTCGEGGCIVSKDKNLLSSICDARLLGVHKDTENRFAGKRSWEFDVTNQGWRYHMSNIMAAIGIEQLKNFQKVVKKRQYLAKQYDNYLSTNKNISFFNINYDHVVPHIYVILLPKNIDREKIRQKMLELGVQTGIHWQPNHLLTIYNLHNNELPVTESLFPRLLTLPLHLDLSNEDIKFVCNSLSSQLL